MCQCPPCKCMPRCNSRWAEGRLDSELDLAWLARIPLPLRGSQDYSSSPAPAHPAASTSLERCSGRRRFVDCRLPGPLDLEQSDRKPREPHPAPEPSAPFSPSPYFCLFLNSSFPFCHRAWAWMSLAFHGCPRRGRVRL